MNSELRLYLAQTLIKEAGRGFRVGGGPFMSDVATGVAWGLGGTMAEKGVGAVSSLFKKRKKPQPNAKQKPEEPKKETEQE